jgi:hypothetical protein
LHRSCSYRPCLFIAELTETSFHLFKLL